MSTPTPENPARRADRERAEADLAEARADLAAAQARRMPLPDVIAVSDDWLDEAEAEVARLAAAVAAQEAHGGRQDEAVARLDEAVADLARLVEARRVWEAYTSATWAVFEADQRITRALRALRDGGDRTDNPSPAVERPHDEVFAFRRPLPTAEPSASPAASQPGAPTLGLTRNHHAGWSSARSVEAAILAIVDGAAERAIWLVADHPTEGSAVYDRVVIGHAHDRQCGWRWRWCGERDEPFSAGSSTICESDAQRSGETTCIALVAAHLAATAERLRWTADTEKVPGKVPWIYRQPVTPGPRAPGL